MDLIMNSTVDQSRLGLVTASPQERGAAKPRRQPVCVFAHLLEDMIYLSGSNSLPCFMLQSEIAYLWIEFFKHWK
jgi:hypothetical protein